MTDKEIIMQVLNEEYDQLDSHCCEEVADAIVLALKDAHEKSPVKT